MKHRVYTFDGVRNFRDFGGYSGFDGRKIRTGVLFRSAQFGEATPADMEKLDQLNIKVQADLRRPDERERHGHRWPSQGVRVLNSDKGSPSTAPHVRFLTEAAVDAAQAEQWMVDYYIEAPFRKQHVETFTAWFEVLCNLKEGEAAVVNCAAGKDRTGILCALTHHVLGVDPETMFEDYLLTNEAAKVEERLPEMARMFNENIDKSYDHDVYRPFIGVRSIYLENAMTSIKSRFGSIDTYLKDVLAVDKTEIDQLHDKFLD